MRRGRSGRAGDLKAGNTALTLSNRAKGGQKGEGPPYEVGVECRQEVDPHNVSTLIFLSRQDIRDEVVPVEEPPLPENVQDFEHRGAIILLNLFQGRAGRTRGRGGRRGHFHLLVGKGEDWGGNTSSGHRDDGGKKATSWHLELSPQDVCLLCVFWPWLGRISSDRTIVL